MPSSSRARRRLVAALLLLVALALGATGFDRRPAAAAAGTGFEGVPGAPSARAGSEAGRLRVGTFNVHSGRSPEGEDSLEGIAETLADLDFAGLQEVRDPWLAPDQAATLGRSLGRSWCYAPSERRFWRDHFGNAALSALPVRSWRRVPLPNTLGKAYRNYLVVTVEWNGVLARVLVTHLDRREDRVPQLEEVLRAFGELETPAVLLGDLNTPPQDPGLQELLAGVPDALDASPPDAPGRVDWILVRGLRVVDRGARDRGASDHPCLWAELALPGS